MQQLGMGAGYNLHAAVCMTPEVCWLLSRAADSYAALSRDQVNLVAAEAARLYQRSVMAVREMHDAAQSSLPEPTY